MELMDNVSCNKEIWRVYLNYRCDLFSEFASKSVNLVRLKMGLNCSFVCTPEMKQPVTQLTLLVEAELSKNMFTAKVTINQFKVGKA